MYCIVQREHKSSSREILARSSVEEKHFNKNDQRQLPPENDIVINFLENWLLGNSMAASKNLNSHLKPKSTLNSNIIVNSKFVFVSNVNSEMKRNKKNNAKGTSNKVDVPTNNKPN